jgi:hypothetical protein
MGQARPADVAERKHPLLTHEWRDEIETNFWLLVYLIQGIMHTHGARGRLYWRGEDDGDNDDMRAVKEGERTAWKRPIECAVIYSCSCPGR